MMINKNQIRDELSEIIPIANSKGNITISQEEYNTLKRIEKKWSELIQFLHTNCKEE